MEAVLIVDDEKNYPLILGKVLEEEGFETFTANSGLDALEILKNADVDLVVTDMKMPSMDGMELLRRLRQSSDMPVIFLTSKDEEIDEMLGLKMGADDYINKPFSQRLLIERIRAVLRRTGADRKIENGERDAKDQVVVRGKLTLDPLRHLVKWGDREIRLTVTEFLILQSLAQRPGHVKSRDQLMDAAYADDVYVDDRTIDSHIKRLRKKFRAADDSFASIETLYGVGYRYSEV